MVRTFRLPEYLKDHIQNTFWSYDSRVVNEYTTAIIVALYNYYGPVQWRNQVETDVYDRLFDSMIFAGVSLSVVPDHLYELDHFVQTHRSKLIEDFYILLEMEDPQHLSVSVNRGIIMVHSYAL